MRRVLIVSPHFPPDTSAGAHRVRLLAPHLPCFGWDPTVVTVEPSAYEGRLDRDLEELVPASLRVVRVPAWPAEVTRRIGIGDLGLRSLAGVWNGCARMLDRERFDALFITIYPTYPALLGPPLKARYTVPLVLDYQDPWVGAWGLDVGGGTNGAPDLKSRLTRALAAHLEPQVVRRADALTAVSAKTYEDVLERNPDAHPRACADIPLGFEEADLDALRASPRPNRWFDTSDGLVHVCYVGTVLPKGIPIIRSVLAALRALRADSPAVYARLRFHFLGTSNQRDASSPPRVLPLASDMGVDDVVSEVPPRLDYLDALNVQVTASALLLMGSTEPHYTPSKVFPALLAGRPLVAVYHEASNVVDILRRASGTLVLTFSGEHAVGDIVPRLTDAFRRLACPSAMSRPARVLEGIEEWSARSCARRLAGVLDAVAP